MPIVNAKDMLLKATGMRSLFQFNYQRNVTSVLPRESGERFG